MTDNMKKIYDIWLRDFADEQYFYRTAEVAQMDGNGNCGTDAIDKLEKRATQYGFLKACNLMEFFDYEIDADKYLAVAAMLEDLAKLNGMFQKHNDKGNKVSHRRNGSTYVKKTGDYIHQKQRFDTLEKLLKEAEKKGVYDECKEYVSGRVAQAEALMDDCIHECEMCIAQHDYEEEYGV